MSIVKTMRFAKPSKQTIFKKPSSCRILEDWNCLRTLEKKNTTFFQAKKSSGSAGSCLKKCVEINRFCFYVMVAIETIQSISIEFLVHVRLLDFKKSTVSNFKCAQRFCWLLLHLSKCKHTSICIYNLMPAALT